MANVIIIKWGILPTYLPYSMTFLPTYRLVDLPITTFVIDWGAFTWVVRFFGVKNGPPTY